MDAFTWVLQAYPTVIPCSTLMTVRWRLGGEWYCATPQPIPCEAPSQLNVTFGLDDTYYDFTLGLSGGIYSDAQREQHRLFQIAQNAREAVMAKVTNAAIDGDRQGALGLPIAVSDMEELSREVSAYIFPFFFHLGETWTYFMGICVFLGLLKMVFGFLIRGYIIYRERGFGLWILAAFWHTAFLVVRLPVETVMRAANFLMQEQDFRIPGEPRNPVPAIPGDVPANAPPPPADPARPYLELAQRMRLLRPAPPVPAAPQDAEDQPR